MQLRGNMRRQGNEKVSVAAYQDITGYTQTKKVLFSV
jgi:hypothetical protein